MNYYILREIYQNFKFQKEKAKNIFKLIFNYFH